MSSGRYRSTSAFLREAIREKLERLRRERPMKGSRDKKRPMLVVSDDAFNRNERYTKVMAVHVTKVKRLGGPYDWEVSLPRGTAGLKHASVAKCGEIYTLWKDQLDGSAGTLPAGMMRQIDRALAAALNLRLED